MPTRPYNWTATIPAEQALAELVLDWRAPLHPGCEVLRATDGRCYVYEVSRWEADPVVREVAPHVVDFPLLQDYPGVYDIDAEDRPVVASGELTI